MELGRLKIGIERSKKFTWLDVYPWKKNEHSSCGCGFLTLFNIYFCWASKECKCAACNNWSCTCEIFFKSIEGENFAEYPPEAQ